MITYIFIVFVYIVTKGQTCGGLKISRNVALCMIIQPLCEDLIYISSLYYVRMLYLDIYIPCVFQLKLHVSKIQR